MANLTGLCIWKNVCILGYFPLESFLSIAPLIDEAVLCVDPTSSDETVALAEQISRKYDKARVIPFTWPKESSNGSAIGVASNYALGHARGDWCVNVQADECWPTPLMVGIRDDWQKWVRAGVTCLRFKVLALEHNGQQLQGGGTWAKQNGAGYTHSIKMWRRSPEAKLAPDGWSIDGCGATAGVILSETYPILHGHDWFRDTVIERRRSQAEEIFSDVPHYRATYEAMRDGQGQWAGLFEDEKWLRTTSPFGHLMPDYMRVHLGKTKYEVNWDLL